MRPLDEDLWVADQPLRFGGVEIGARMSVLRLRDGSLLLHSPIAVTPALRVELDALGPVRYAVAPNRFHHLWAGEAAEAWPDCRLYVAPGLREKRPDLPVAGVLPDDAPEAWRGEIECVLFEGFPLANEVALVHTRTRTLLTCDLAFNVGPEAPLATRLLFRLLGRYDECGPTFAERLLVRDRAAAARSLERILALDFDRIVVSHGRVLEHGGPEALRRGYAWLPLGA